ncbi:MAG: sugar phosphate isomerase/epimerase [Clostridia bacterium]|nr:sugar phosphate isomerase/epimerase [Clostridia bacterium]
MKLAVMSPVLAEMGLEGALAYLAKAGVHSMELGVGGYPGKALCDAGDYLKNPEKIENLKALLKKYDVELCALAVHGNPIHPNKEIAKSFESDFDDAVLLAEKLGIDTLITFSGCPGDCAESKNPNWVTCAWPEDYQKILDWQWNEVLIPYWKEAAAIAATYGVKKIALEMHPGFCVYNPATLLRLREAVGNIIGANFDPSHLIWQGMDPVAALRELRGAVYHFHAKDTRVDPYNKAVNGVLDTGTYGDLSARSWVFRTVGYGTDTKAWKDIISTLAVIGYDGAVSIEHEDGLMSPQEGLEKAVAFLKDILINDDPAAMWWL